MIAICFCGTEIRPKSRDWESGEPVPKGKPQMWCTNMACSEYLKPIFSMPQNYDPSVN